VIGRKLTVCFVLYIIVDFSLLA